MLQRVLYGRINRVPSGLCAGRDDEAKAGQHLYGDILGDGPRPAIHRAGGSPSNLGVTASNRIHR